MVDAMRLRGLPFKSEVGMIELTGWEYGTRTREMADALGGDDLRAFTKLAVAGGFLPEGSDLTTLAASFAAASASATYSPLDKQVLLVDRVKSDSLLAHEVVHALQDQHFDLLSMLSVRPYSLDRVEATFALIEGDAMDVQRRLESGESFDKRPLEEIARQENERLSEYRTKVGALFPPLLTETFIFRYRDGLRFVETLRRTKNHNVNELFAHPPVSSEQVLHPEKYLAGETPREIKLDEEGFKANNWRSTISTPLGEIGIRGVLMAALTDKEAARAAAGWGGDCAYLFERERTAPLFVWKTVWDRPADAEEFYRAYNALCHKDGQLISAPAVTDNEAQALWQSAGLTVIVQRKGAAVIIVRGARADVDSALALADR
jgi:hypothetical protein